MSVLRNSMGNERKKKVVPDKDEVLARMTDPNLYTGFHKHRFDSSGHGLGKQNRLERDFVPSMFLTADEENDEKKGMSRTGNARSTPAFEKMTDPKFYTGIHRHRFDKKGHGLGLAGRERILKGLGTNPSIPYLGGPIMDISQITRTASPVHVYKKVQKLSK